MTRRAVGICLGIILAASTQLLSAVRTLDDASTLIHQALEAQGGEQKLRSIQNTHWNFVGYRNEIEESERPEGPYIAEFDQTDEIHDFENFRYLSVTSADVYPVFRFTRGILVTKGTVFRIMNSKKLAGPSEYLQVVHERLALSPERLLLTAADARDLHREPDTMLQSVPQNVLRFDLDGFPVRIFLNAHTHLPTAVDYGGPSAHTGFWAYLGDITLRTWYSSWWLAKGGIHLPMQWNIEGNGLPDQMVVVKRLRLNEGIREEQFAIPPDIGNQPHPKSVSPEDVPFGGPGNSPEEIAPGVILLPGPWNVTLIRQRDGIVVLEAPISSTYSTKVIAEARRLFPGQRIKAVISTSDSWPHLAGIRQFVAEQIPIYALNLNHAILTRIVDSPHISRPDDLQRTQRKPDVHLISEKAVIGSGENRLELFSIRGETTERQMMVYLPEQKLLYGSDAFQRNPDGTYNLPQTVTELMDAVNREHLNVRKYFMMHIKLSSWSDLQGVISDAISKDSPNAVE